jgi:subtilisin family serine protease
VLVAIALLAMLAPASASGADVRTASGPDELSPRLAALAKPSLRGAPPAVQARKLSVAAVGPGSLLRDGSRVLVEVRFDGGVGDGVEGLRDAGAEIVHVSDRYLTATVAATPADLPAISAVPGVGGVTEVLAPIVSAECRGLVTSEGDAQLDASSAREDFAVDGSGVTVGILSDSFDTFAGAPTHAANDVGSGDLPGSGNPCGRSEPVGVLFDYSAVKPKDPAQADEGRAMAQIVHDLAPGASIDFATAFQGELGFAANIRALRNVGADVIVDDVLYLGEPFFQDGPIAVAINDVTGGGAAYFSAAGNSNEINGGRDIASWEAPSFRDTSCPAELQAAPLEVDPCMDFDPGAGVDPTFQVTVPNGETLKVNLQWAQSWNAVTADLDVFLLDSTDKPIKIEEFVVGSGDDNVGDSQRPVEILQWKNQSGGDKDVRLAIARCFGPCNPAADPLALPRVKFVLFSGAAATEYESSKEGDVVGPAIFGHAGASSAIGVGAVPFNNSSIVESYSSRGPVTHYFGPMRDATPAPPIVPTEIPKPDLVATDGGANTFFGQPVSGVRRFFGTSAAAPHAAAVAALMRQANPSLPLGQLRLALAATARPVGTFGPNAAGAGLVYAFGAVSSVALPPTVSITESPPPLGRIKRPTFGFAANRPVSFRCSIDGGGLQPCTSPFAPLTPLSDGTHGFVVTATDVAGRTGRSPVVSFEIDSKRPRAFFRKRPPRTIRTRHRRAKAVFRFGASERNVTFVCRVDGGLPRFCKPRFVKRFRVGKHVLRVRAKDLAGNVSRKPAVHRFKVKRRG